MDENQDQQPDLSTRVNESELPKPGSSIVPTVKEQPNLVKPTEAQTQPVSSISPQVEEIKKLGLEQVKQSEQTESVAMEANEPEKLKSGLHFLWEITKTLLIAAVVVFTINTFIFQAYYVSGNSMNPDFHDGDYLLINKFKTSLFNISRIFNQQAKLNLKRGDVIVFHPLESQSIFFIKRILALPGERITLKNGVFTIYNQENPKGFVLKEPYIDPDYKTEGEVDITVKEGEVFVVGDNRAPNASYDSRAWGPLPEDHISGTVFFRLIPLNNLGFLSLPQY